MALRVMFTGVSVPVSFAWGEFVWEGRGMWVLEFGGVWGMKLEVVESACVGKSYTSVF